MQRHFDEELKELKSDLLAMAAQTEEAIRNSIEALKNQDEGLAKDIIQKDKKIDELELIIEERAINLLALRQPLAADLRFITTGMRINAELERIADLAVNIAKRAEYLADKEMLGQQTKLADLSEMAQKMVKQAIDAFVNKDAKLAEEIILSDNKADDLQYSIHKQLLDEYILPGGKVVYKAFALILAASHLERICDHATYIAEDVIYMAKAEVVKHHPERLGS